MKRVVVAIMVGLVGVTCLFASGSDETPTAQTSAAVVNRTGYPIVSEPITYEVTAVQHAWARDWGDMPLFQAYEELTDIQINWTMIPDSEHVEKTNLMLATASYPDVYMGTRGLGPKTDETIQQGVIMPLDDLIAEWAPNIRAFFAEVPEVRAAATYPDGKIYGFPSYENGSYHLAVSDKWFVVLSWLDALDLEMPTTTEEFYQMLRAFKEQDPNGNGRRDEIPLAFNTGPQGEIESWIHYFGPWGVVDTVMVDAGRVFWGFQDEGFREATRFFRRLVDEGLLDKESIVQTQDQRRARAIVDGEVVLGVGPSLAPQFVWNDMSIVFKYDDSRFTLDTMDELAPNPNRMIGVIPPFAGPAGENLWRLQTGVNMGFGRGYIFNDAPLPEAMVRWFDHWYDGGRDGFSMVSGLEGIRWDQNPDTGAYIEYSPPEDLGMNHQEWRQWHTPVNAYYWNREGEIRKPVLPRHIMLEEYTDVYLDHVPAESFPANLVKTVGDEIDILAQYEQELMGFVWETMARFIFGDVDIDAEWPRFLAQTGRMRADEILAVKQAQYDRYVEALNN